ncbi:hypothetical protein Mal64_23260 [Pseudobythopirellula maris]|uniref:Zinc-finger domain-containing protein n=1 Tax=Pseudobythopirellula maris TaxID=2527991 RepID=A0A5C5ZNS6_9BACT|nr:hypothetical protein [Pseudobythopirellula maris]TWT88838.1 hypothetical protein Mal64_23260 [Pseudobythopirellula maris]
MECDRVFWVLTSGPFPTGGDDDLEVDRHLSRCASCWKFAAALQPFDHIEHESLTPFESRDLPGYWGERTPPRELLEELTSASPARQESATAGAAAPVAAPQLVPPLVRPRVATAERRAELAPKAWLCGSLLASAAAAVWWLF